MPRAVSVRRRGGIEATCQDKLGSINIANWSGGVNAIRDNPVLLPESERTTTMQGRQQ